MYLSSATSPAEVKHMEETKIEAMEETKPEAAQEVQQVQEAPTEPTEPTQPTETMPQSPAPARRRDDNTVFIGKKGTMGYVLAVVTQFNNGASEVVVKARGKLISRAVDVVEIVRHRFLPDARVDDISIATEELTSEDGSKSKVSSIEVKIVK
jgi:DNA-binding protein